ncbi:hypothetical protein KI387_003230, partial [Taxus chinensis]
FCFSVIPCLSDHFRQFGGYTKPCYPQTSSLLHSLFAFTVTDTGPLLPTSVTLTNAGYSLTDIGYQTDIGYC